MITNKKSVNINVNKHIHENIGLYLLTILCLFTGMILGIYTIRYMDVKERQELVNYFLTFKDNIRSTEINRGYIIVDTLKNNLPIILGIWLLGVTMVGMPIILIIDIIKGYTLGFTLTFLFMSLGIKGSVFVLIGVIPQNIIYIPCIIIASVLAMKLSAQKLKEKFNRDAYRNYYSFSSYSLAFIIILVLVLIGAFYEAYITPNAVKAVALSLGSASI